MSSNLFWTRKPLALIVIGMMKSQKTACVFGGTGFVGRQIVRGLAQAGYRVKVATRVPESAYFLKPCGTVGQVVPVTCDYKDNKSIVQALTGADVVVNCIGILFQRRRSDFQRLHTLLPETIAKACGKQGVKRFIQISSLGVDSSRAKYAKTKLEGENRILKAFPDVTIMRPSVIFGPDDNFFNMFAKLAGALPVLPLIGGGKTQFQPVYVGDVADAVMAAIDDGRTKGKTYQLGGPDVVSFKEIYNILFTHIGYRRALVSLPYFIAKIEGAFFSLLLPNPPLTADQVESLKTHNIVSKDALTLKDLKITPTAMSLILPTYLERYRPGGKFAEKQAAS